MRTFFDSKKDVTPEDETGQPKEANDDLEEACERSDMGGKIKNPYWNPSQQPPSALALYITAIKEGIKGIFSLETQLKDNLSQNERLALENLKQREDIIIQQADKGGKIVIMNKDEYVNACAKMLEDEEFYQAEKGDRNEEFSKEIKKRLDELSEYISDKEKRYLEEDLIKPRTPLFYGLPKIHKVFTNVPPMRPIVSGFCSCTTKLSEFLDSFLKYHAQRCKSYIKDTNQFLLKLQSLKKLPLNTILVTFDVSSLYTNIDQEEGAEACFKKLEQRRRKDIPSILLKNLILLVLRCNVFRFGSSFYSQRKGTCMGTPMAPNYANLFMDEFEENLINDFFRKTGKKPLIWWRYIDDIFCIWTEGEDTLKDFMDHAQSFSRNNKLRSNIQFTSNQSTNEVDFLDVTVQLKNGIITTTVFSKPTDSHLYLDSRSNHPTHVVRNIPKSQFMRLRRICSDTVDFSNQCSRYSKFFINRGYDKIKIHNTVRQVAKMSREDLLKAPRTKDDKDRVVFACNWHPHLGQLPRILKQHHYILKNDRNLTKLFKDPPLVAYRRAKTIRNEVVKHDVLPPSDDVTVGTVPCKSCKAACHLICEETTITNSSNGKTIDVTACGNCKTQDLVYAARCKVCDMIYIGETGEPLKIRICKHRYDANKRPDNCELASHVHKMGHDFDKDIEFLILKQGFKSKEERKFYEDKIICKLGTLIPEGLNKDLDHYGREMYDIHQHL